ncbi:TrmH family RNA methyltransferase [Ulvibacter sp. MAR_2010_11]|uniref:TrmH family RNA methyltransferase n=1 Tax=Ulvibacter sp. MAR_2010_11 TaxID=1250229 RepID=UPI000CA8F30C|nr:RNA methyltransferase [Ulvibacter sp. MAR_2010_11]PKA82330.1 TrmH family RNA methyltransferase [Ulvibacter sp. MAR_2010_11]
MVSKSQIKLITSLQQKKYRDKTGLFVAEGPKVIAELQTAGLKLYAHFSTEFTNTASEKEVRISEAELQKISFLKSPNTSLAIFEIPKQKEIQTNGLQIALDAVRDPGNLGTIIRLCDWFGVTQLICSPDTADCFNPKVIQATMGSIVRIQIVYCSLSEYIKNSPLPVYGACMEGTNVYSAKYPEEALIVMGNEANGISKEIMGLLHEKITIPQFGVRQDTESLNVATATAILLSEFRRFTER